MREPGSDAPITDTAFAVFAAATLAFALLVSRFPFVPVLDHVNLAFHEAGHVFFGVLGATAGLYGGTVGQFVFPTLVGVRFWRRGEPLAAAAGALWFCQNLRYTALYARDARERALPLVGGGEHDWALILARWGALEADRRLAAALTAACWLGMLGVLAVVARRWWRDRGHAATTARRARHEAVIAAARERARTPPPR